MPLIQKLKVPGNMMMFCSFIVVIANFELLPTEELDGLVYDLPEEEP